ncbi:MAG: hypothetical protein ACXWCZ_13850, partial [Flavisolibacter sp.]
LQVMGKGMVVTDPEEVNSFLNIPEEEKENLLNEMVIVKVKMTKAEYFETRTVRTSWWQSAVSAFTTWFRNSNNQYRPDIYYPAS